MAAFPAAVPAALLPAAAVTKEAEVFVVVGLDREALLSDLEACRGEEEAVVVVPFVRRCCCCWLFLTLVREDSRLLRILARAAVPVPVPEPAPEEVPSTTLPGLAVSSEDETVLSAARLRLVE